MPRGVPNTPRTTTAKTAPAKESPAITEEGEVQKEPRFQNYSPRDITRDFEGTLYVRNETHTFVSFDDGNGNILKLGQVGSTESIAELPKNVARHPGFQRFWRQGKVTVSDNPEMDEQLEKFAHDEAERDRTRQFEIETTIYNPRSQTLEWPGIGDITPKPVQSRGNAVTS
jgi:hypothetical protein